MPIARERLYVVYDVEVRPAAYQRCRFGHGEYGHSGRELEEGGAMGVVCELVAEEDEVDWTVCGLKGGRETKFTQCKTFNVVQECF